MSRNEYWNGDIYTAFDYVEAEQHRQKRLNNLAWLQGKYVFDAIAVVVSNALSKDSHLSYPERPYGYEKTAKEKELEEENEMLRAEAYMKQMVEVGKNWGKEK